jgi:hypothetical protein
MLGDEAMPAAAIGADVFIQDVHLVLNSKYAEGLQQRCGLCLCGVARELWRGHKGSGLISLGHLAGTWAFSIRSLTRRAARPIPSCGGAPLFRRRTGKEWEVSVATLSDADDEQKEFRC